MDNFSNSNIFLQDHVFDAQTDEQVYLNINEDYQENSPVILRRSRGGVNNVNRVPIHITNKNSQLQQNQTLHHAPLQPRASPAYPAPKYDPDNESDVCLQLLTSNRDVITNGDDLKGVLGPLLKNKNLYELGAAALKSKAVANPNIAPVLSMMFYLAAETREAKKGEDQPLKSNTEVLLVDAYTLKVNASKMAAKDFIISTPHPFRPIQVRSALLHCQSMRKKGRMVLDIKAVVRVCLQQMYSTLEEAVQHYYSEARLSTLETRFPKEVAEDMKRIISSFGTIDLDKRAKGIIVPEMDSCIWYKQVSKAIQDLLSDARRKVVRFTPFTEEMYIRSLQYDPDIPVNTVLEKRARAPVEAQPEMQAPLEEEIH